MNHQEYWKEVKDLAECIIEDANENVESGDYDEAQDVIDDYLLHEYVDSHQWVTYYSYSLDMIEHTQNEDYMLDNFGSDMVASALKDGLDGLHQAVAFWAFYADISDEIGKQLGE